MMNLKLILRCIQYIINNPTEAGYILYSGIESFEFPKDLLAFYLLPDFSKN